MASIETKLFKIMDPTQFSAKDFFSKLLDGKSELWNKFDPSFIEDIDKKHLDLFAKLLTGHGDNTANKQKIKEAFFNYCQDIQQELIRPTTIIQVLQEHKRFCDEEKILYSQIVFKIAENLKINDSSIVRSFSSNWLCERLTIDIISNYVGELPGPFVLKLS
jgi:hypothetical protein